MIRSLLEASGAEWGGKARGLARLLKLGMRVPEGIVLLASEDSAWKSELEEYLEDKHFDGMAVRSSSVSEDGDKASFAGQFESFLNCRNKDEIFAAVEACIQSFHKERVGSYREHFHMEDDPGYPIIIQEMVRAEKSGVIFTANPVSGLHDEWLIDVTSGLAEKLMAGSESGEQVVLTRNGRILKSSSLLSESEVETIYRDARKISNHFLKAMDLEWAIDSEGRVSWVQARPITTLKKVHPNELDGDLNAEDEIFTRANIGEMMPGPVTPLTYSTFGRAIEVGLQDFYIACGVLKNFSDEWIYFRMFYNHLFFSMSRLTDISEHVLLNKKENVEFSIMGETLDDDRKLNPKSFPVRAWKQLKQFRYLAASAKRVQKLETLAAGFRIHEDKDLLDLYIELNESLSVLNQAYAHHYCASSQSGTYQSALMSILSGGKGVPDISHYSDAAYLLSDLQDLESADVLHFIDSLYERFKKEEIIMDWARSTDPHFFNQNKELVLQDFQKQLDQLILKNGHRCIREGEFREKSWSDDPDQLFMLIKKRFLAGDSTKEQGSSYEENFQRIAGKLGRISRYSLHWVLSRARTAVARRESTKSNTVRIQDKIKKGYQRLAELMVEKELLDDTDQVFFLTHQELGRCIDSDDKSWKEVARERRDIFPDSFKIDFPDVSRGFPEPLREEEKKININGDAVQGLPVSAGSVEASIRIVKKVEDASDLQKGEILLCKYTDVGWTPYFSLASGLITEIGSPLSHGAVVAREYGIPAVVNAKGALDFFVTGDRVVLDGATGVIRKRA